MKAPRGWRTLDFPADNTGWRAVYLNDDNPGWTFERVVGWLLQEDVVYDARTCENLPPDDQPPLPNRRVVAGVVDRGVIEPASEPENFWYLLAPSELDPTEQAAPTERHHRQQLKQLRSHRAQETAASPDTNSEFSG